MSEVSIDALLKERPLPLWHDDGITPFDFDEVERRLAKDSTVMDREDVDAAEAIARLVRWLHSSGCGRPRSLDGIGLRVIAIAWLLEPGGVGSRSASSVAADLGVTKQMLQRYVVQASKQFGLKHRFQGHGWNRSKAAKN